MTIIENTIFTKYEKGSASPHFQFIAARQDHSNYSVLISLLTRGTFNVELAISIDFFQLYHYQGH